jgi:hypothetical protein
LCSRREAWRLHACAGGMHGCCTFTTACLHGMSTLSAPGCYGRVAGLLGRLHGCMGTQVTSRHARLRCTPAAHTCRCWSWARAWPRRARARPWSRPVRGAAADVRVQELALIGATDAQLAQRELARAFQRLQQAGMRCGFQGCEGCNSVFFIQRGPSQPIAAPATHNAGRTSRACGRRTHVLHARTGTLHGPPMEPPTELLPCCTTQPAGCLYHIHSKVVA